MVISLSPVLHQVALRTTDARTFSGSIAICLQSVGQPMPSDRGANPVLEAGTIVKPLHQHSVGTHASYDYALHCPEQPLLLGLSHARTTVWCVDLLATVGIVCTESIVSCPFLVGACSGFNSLDLALTSCQLFLAVLLGAKTLPGPIGSAHIVVIGLLRMKRT